MSDKLDFHRQLDIIDSDSLSNKSFILIGAGGIGSPTAIALTKMGVTDLTVYDPDEIEAHNLPNQMYSLDDIGMKKVDSLYDMCFQFSGVEIKAIHRIFDERPVGNAIVISAVDSMKSRKEIWEFIKYNISVDKYIDARMGAELCRIYTINPTEPNDIEYYEKTLYSDEEASELPCTARAIIYNVFMIAALISSQVKKIINDEDLYREIVFDLVTLICCTET